MKKQRTTCEYLLLKLKTFNLQSAKHFTQSGLEVRNQAFSIGYCKIVWWSNEVLNPHPCWSVHFVLAVQIVTTSIYTPLLVCKKYDCSSGVMYAAKLLYFHCRDINCLTEGL
ncbi:hypothetical protein ILYODFUR_013082 [Ilyodon furcidens]|uniref:Uncharacterized protein n=1 Tax=Ilyodon furcidens TaxID=33524 RepID=A0ABV0U519_9TELE